jgi:hypothetical protein
MRPQSIRRFDLFFLASVVLLVIGFAITFDRTAASVGAEAAARGLQVGSGFTLGVFIAVVVIDLVLWFFVSRKGAGIAKWLLVLLLLIDLFGIPDLVTGRWSTAEIISLVRIALEAVAIAFLFRADANAWFGRDRDDEPTEAVPDD